MAIKCVNRPDSSTAQSTVLDLFHLDLLSTDLKKKNCSNTVFVWPKWEGFCVVQVLEGCQVLIRTEH